jgi:cbb3-type cytochrome oxidase cytochrome c subunit
MTGVSASLLIFGAVAFGQGVSLELEGKRLFTEQGCYGCHTVGKAGTLIGPDLSTIGSKRSEGYLRAWLMDPYLQKPTAHMPALSMKESEARALAAYLASLQSAP